MLNPINKIVYCCKVLQFSFKNYIFVDTYLEFMVVIRIIFITVVAFTSIMKYKKRFKKNIGDSLDINVFQTQDHYIFEHIL